MDDYIGGRYSSTSAVGGAVLSLAFGPEVFAQFLAGAAKVDEVSKNEDLLKNPAMLERYDVGSLVEKLIEGMLSVCSWFSEDHRTCRVIYRLAKAVN